MKNIFRNLGLITLIVLIGFFSTACKDPSNNPSGTTETAAAPTAVPGAGNVVSGTQVELKTATQGASIYYTLDGTTPTVSSELYTDKITITQAVTIKAIAVKSGMNNSSMLTAEYTIDAGLTPITTVFVTLTSPPETGTEQKNTVTVPDDANYTAGDVTWTGDLTDGKFKPSTTYTATVTLTAEEGFAFADLTAAKISNETAALSDNTGGTVTLTASFNTAAGMFQSITIKEQPRAITHGFTLDEDFEITVTYNTGAVSYKLAAFNNITMLIGDEQIYADTPLNHINHNGKKISVRYGNHDPVETNPLIVNQFNISNYETTIITSQTYTGSAIIPPKSAVTFSSANPVPAGSGFAITDDDWSFAPLSNNVNAGTVNVAINAQAGGNFTGSLTGKSFSIIPRNLVDGNVTVTNSSQVWTGQPLAPEVTVKIGDTVIPNDNYTITYTGGGINGETSVTNPGTYSVIVTGKNNLSESITKTNAFTINPAPTYTVTYNGNGQDNGTVPVDTNSPYVSGSTVTVLGNTGNLKKTDFAFIGWITDTNPLVGDDYDEGQTFVITQNTILYAHWIPDAHGISLSIGSEDITSKTHHFPNVTFGYAASPAAQTITVTNIGDNPTGAMSIELTNSEKFTLSTTTLSSINPGGTTTFTIVPKTGLINGHHSSTVTVKSDEVEAAFIASFNVNSGVITINTHPVSPSAFTYGNISGNLSAAASATGGELSYQWYRNTTPVNTGGTEVVTGGTSASFTIPTNLETGTYYYFCEVRATGGAISKRSDVATVTVNRAAGSTVTALTINATTHNSITVNAVTLATATGQEIQYARNTVNEVPANGWGTDRTFGGLNSGVTYYFFARSAENGNYTAGTANNVSQVTLQTIPGNVIAYYWVNEQGQMATTIGSTTLSKNAAATLTINADDAGYTNPIWSVNGITDTTQSGTSYTFSAKGKTVGVQYTIGLRVQKDGKFYNTNFVVTITN